jgi:hypothetical protein
MRSADFSAVAWAMCGLALACSSGSTGGSSTAASSDASTADAATSADAKAPVQCKPAVNWKPGTAAFSEATEQWGLQGIQGARMNVVDYDGDGWTDLFVHGGGKNEFKAGGARDTWLMRNDGKGHFVDVTGDTGLLQTRLDPKADVGMGASVFAAGDVDNDGDLDFFLGRGMATGATDTETSEILLGDGKGHFALGPAENPVRTPKKASVPTSAAFVDFDKDGNLDLWVVHNMPGGASVPLQDRLWKGDGTGKFVDATKDAGLITQGWAQLKNLNEAKAHSWAWAATACDLNNDGFDELLTASYGRVPNHLWRNQALDGGGRGFVNESVASGYAFDGGEDWRDNLSAQCHCKDYPKAAECDTVPDVNPQICKGLAQSFGPNYRWNHATDREPWRLGGNSGTTVCADVDNDGWFDLLTNEIKHSDVGSSSDESELLFNTQDPLVRMERPGNDKTGLTREHVGSYWDQGDITSAIYDFDNDGWLDVHIAASDYPTNRALLYRQVAPRQFVELDTADFFERFRAAGVVAADFDHDGDLDVITGHTRMRCEGQMGKDCQPDNQIHLHENLLGGNHVQFRLEGGAGSNRSAVGARLAVTAGGVTRQWFVDGGHGQGSTQRDPWLHFGLGAECEVEVQVAWPDAAGTVEKFHVAGNQRWRVVQGKGAQPWP